MDSNNELLDNYPFPKVIEKIEPIDVDFIKKEEIEEECHVEPGVMVSFRVNKVSVNEKTEETENCSSSKVRKNLSLFYGVYVT